MEAAQIAQSVCADTSPSPAPSSEARPAPTTRADMNRALRIVVSERFRVARELNGWDPQEAAIRVGMSDSVPIRLIEAARCNVSAMMLMAASRAFGVSVDFLIGLSLEPDREAKVTARAAVMRHVRSMLEDQIRNVESSMHTHLEQEQTPMRRTRALVRCATEVVNAFDRFATRNGTHWIAMPSGAQLSFAVGELQSLVEIAREAVSVFDRSVYAQAPLPAQGRQAQEQAAPVLNEDVEI